MWIVFLPRWAEIGLYASLPLIVAGVNLIEKMNK